MTVAAQTWWKDGTVYQIYPASFKDSNGDGLGDIPGIISKLDYLKDLGIDIIWISPMYDSPQVDMGYDVRDYEKVYTPFGTVADMEDLIEQAHSRGLKIILDLVINHTSDQHAWFQESRSSKDNPKRDWYVWRPARYDENGNRMPPNNWRSFFSEPAWQWDEHTKEYYLHLFAKEQPDLNWENDDTRNAIYNSALRFWLDKGVDGFRIDTVNMYSKQSSYPDAPIVDSKSFSQPAASTVCNGPRMHEYLREMNSKVLNQYDTMTVGELPFTPDPAHVLRYVGANDRQIDMCFQFDLCDLGLGPDHKFNIQPWSVGDIKRILSQWQTFHQDTDGWTTAFIENHDQGRSVSRYTSDDPKYRSLCAKLLAIMITTLTGTLYIYQGQEIGMINAPRSWSIGEYPDIESSNYYKLVSEQTGNDPAALSKAMDAIQVLARDHARLPMQWDDGPNAGFTPPDCKAKPWMKVHDEYKEINVAAQQQQQKDDDKDPSKRSSVLTFWKQMLRLRKQYKDIFIHGQFKCLDTFSYSYSTGIDDSKSETENETDRLFLYTKTSSTSTAAAALIVLNFSGEERTWKFPLSSSSSSLSSLNESVGAEANTETNTYHKTEAKTESEKKWKIQACNYEEQIVEGRKMEIEELQLQSKLKLRPWEARVYMLED